MGVTDVDEWEVVGESRYLPGIIRIRDLASSNVDDNKLYALLVAEPLNPFDHHAVRVDLVCNYEREICGYLPREQAYQVQQFIKTAYDAGHLVFRNAALFGGTEEKPNIGVWLSSTDVRVPANTQEPAGQRQQVDVDKQSLFDRLRAQLAAKQMERADTAAHPLEGEEDQPTSSMR